MPQDNSTVAIVETFMRDDFELIADCLLETNNTEAHWIADRLRDMVQTNGYVTYGVIVGETKTVTEWR